MRKSKGERRTEVTNLVSEIKKFKDTKVTVDKQDLQNAVIGAEGFLDVTKDFPRTNLHIMLLARIQESIDRLNEVLEEMDGNTMATDKEKP